MSYPTFIIDWANLVGIKPVRVLLNLPEYVGGPINAAYTPANPADRWPATIGVTPLYRHILDDEGLKSVLAHEFGHAIQDAFDPAFVHKIPSRSQEDGADAIAGILLKTADSARRSYEVGERTAKYLGTSIEGGGTHAPYTERLQRIETWATWAQSKSDAERRKKIIALAREEIPA